jgi:hypothetical protein
MAGYSCQQRRRRRFKRWADFHMPHLYLHDLSTPVWLLRKRDRLNGEANEYITLTPESFFHLSATDPTLVSLPEPIPPSLEKVRFPGLSTLYDALLSTINAPEQSEYSFGLEMQLKQYIGYLHLYCFSEYVRKWYKDVKDLPEPILEVGLALRTDGE